MAATDQQIADSARDALKRILDTDSSELSDQQRRMRHLEIDKLRKLIDESESSASRNSGRRILQPVRRVNL